MEVIDVADQAPEGSAAALQEFLAWAGRTGEMNPKTAEAWAVACRRVLDVESDLDAVDVRNVDVDNLLKRFENLNRTQFTPGSMSTYKSRFTSAVAAYRAWLNNEPWKPQTRNTRKSAQRDEPAATTVAPDAEKSRTQQIDAPAHESKPLLVAYKMPLRPDLMVDLSLPTDLTARDADRIAAFVRSLAFVAEPEKEPG